MYNRVFHLGSAIVAATKIDHARPALVSRPIVVDSFLTCVFDKVDSIQSGSSRVVSNLIRKGDAHRSRWVQKSPRQFNSYLALFVECRINKNIEMENFWPASTTNRVTMPLNTSTFLYLNTATCFRPFRTFSGPSKQYFKASQRPASWKPAFTIIMQFCIVLIIVNLWDPTEWIHLYCIYLPFRYFTGGSIMIENDRKM
jgi:hypothetical protein